MHASHVRTVLLSSLVAKASNPLWMCGIKPHDARRERVGHAKPGTPVIPWAEGPPQHGIAVLTLEHSVPLELGSADLLEGVGCLQRC